MPSLIWFKLIFSNLIFQRHGKQVLPSLLAGKPAMHLKFIALAVLFKPNTPISFSLAFYWLPRLFLFSSGPVV